MGESGGRKRKFHMIMGLRFTMKTTKTAARGGHLKACVLMPVRTYINTNESVAVRLG